MEKDVEQLFEGVSKEILTEDVKTKIATLIESKVNEKYNSKVQELDEQFESFKKDKVEELDEAAVEYVDNYLIERIDGFLDSVSEKWLEEHSVEVEDGVKSELYDSLVNGMKGILKENQIKEEDIETQTSIKEEKEKIEEDYNALFEENTSLKNENLGLMADQVFKEETSALTESEKSRVQDLSEDFDIDDADAFRSKVKTIVEYVTKTPKSVTENKNDDDVTSDNPDIITESTNEDDTYGVKYL